MNLITTQYKKIALLATIVAAVSMSSVLSAGCSACAAAAAIRQSIKDAQAAALAEGKKSLEAELDEIDGDESIDRAAREELVDPCSPCVSGDCPVDNCSINCKMQALYNCCVCTNNDLRNNGYEAKKCCKHLRHKIDDLEDEVEECCSSIETLIGDPTAQVQSLQDCFIDVLAYVNTNNVDTMTWAKRLYVLMYQIFSCTCCNF